MPVTLPGGEGVAARQGEADLSGSGAQAGGHDDGGADAPAQFVRDDGAPFGGSAREP
ncbi:hypothetical protein ACFW2Y_35620 [Streptomyces sp. NPDC058877]|uniref:hypothetical protein n=1 Tax=Streptomyces sp. NPDC058877 TaxID=3346665 RepID=UPI0036C896E4